MLVYGVDVLEVKLREQYYLYSKLQLLKVHNQVPYTLKREYHLLDLYMKITDAF